MSKKYIALTVAGFVLFKIGAAIAYESRGYHAIGGEVLLLLLPFIWYGVEDMVRGMARLWKEVLEDDDII